MLDIETEVQKEDTSFQNSPQQNEVRSEPKANKKKGKTKTEIDKYPLPTNQDFLSYYIQQRKWEPTSPYHYIGAHFKSPGPAYVKLPSTIGKLGKDQTKPAAPAYKIGIRTIERKRCVGPGPQKYNHQESSVKCKESSAPKFGKAARFQDKTGDVSPGPAAHNRTDGDKCIQSRAPSYSMPQSQRTKMRAAGTPGPNAYSLPTGLGPGKTPIVTGPSYSIGKSQREASTIKTQSPGPAAYGPPSNNVHMRKTPGFHMGIKLDPPGATSWLPGPAAHAAHMVKYDKHSTPRITFGIRHTPYEALPGFAAEK